MELENLTEEQKLELQKRTEDIIKEIKKIYGKVRIVEGTRVFRVVGRTIATGVEVAWYSIKSCWKELGAGVLAAAIAASGEILLGGFAEAAVYSLLTCATVGEWQLYLLD